MPQTQSNKIDDLVAWEINPGYTRKELVLRNVLDSTINITNSFGMGVKVVGSTARLMEAGDMDDATGLIISNKPVVNLAESANTTEKHTILIAGPAIVRKNGLATVDGEGSSVNINDLITALAVSKIIVKSQPTVTTSQTT